MKTFRFLASSVALSGALAGVAPAFAQYPPATSVQMIPAPTPDADALAATMRRLGANPLDLDALLTGAELSMKLGDLSAAAALLARAEKVDPMNGRMKAGQASILVREERPAEALRYFGQAEGYGYDPRRFASDRGLAYDLIGEQQRAQRDYRTALQERADDETVRRYALSLGISGREDEALEQIDTLLRKSDRGAWRARAFILAMNGDIAEASRIARSMMPGIAAGLQPFFTRLPTLGATDRAFAVHFGEVHPTPERLADARFRPALAALPPEPRAAPVLAAAQPVAKPEKKKRDRKRKGQIERVAVASAAPRVAALPPPPGFGDPGASPTDPIAIRPATSVAARPATAAPAPASPPARTLGGTQVAATVPTPAYLRAETLQRTTLAGAVRAAPQPVPRPAPTVSKPEGRDQTVEPEPVNVAAAAPSGTAPTGPNPGVRESATAPEAPNAAVAANPAPSSSAAVVANVASPVAASPAAPQSSQLAANASPSPAPTAAMPVPPQMSEDSILARIVAGISIPGYELGVGAPPAPPPPPPEPAAKTEAAAANPVAIEPQPVVDAAAEAKKEQERKALAVTKAAAEKKALAAKKAADDKAATAKKAADDKKALAAKKVAEEKALAAKKIADEKMAAKADSARIWVQVAGGAYEGDLPKAWAAVKAKAPVLAGRQGYSTPLRATNRVVTGPFKTNDEAQAFVNQLGRQGVSAFTFTSSPGQKVTKLPAK